MANTIALTTKFIPLLDLVYKQTAKTSILEAPSALVQQTADANVIKIAKFALQGLGNYSKTNGFPAGDITLSWETHTFSNDRGRRFGIDRMDNMESFELTSANLVGEFLRTLVIPEVDAYRFSKIAAGASASTTATAADLTTASATKAAIDAGIVKLQELEVDTSGCVLFITPTLASLLEGSITRTVMNGDGNVQTIIENYNGLQIVRVPQTRFYAGVTLYDGTTGGQEAGGYVKTPTTGRNINFLIVNKQASLNITKLNVGKLITPDQNQNKDQWQFDFRMYHETFVPDNKTIGIYKHLATS